MLVLNFGGGKNVQTVSGRVRGRVVPLGGVYTFSQAAAIPEPAPVHNESSSKRAAKIVARFLRDPDLKDVAPRS
jgi:hypothetical protein